MTFLFFVYLFKLAGILLMAYLPGRLLLNLTSLPDKNKPYFTTFLALLIGFLGIASGIAVYATGFITVLTINFLVLAGLLFFYRQKRENAEPIFRGLGNPVLLVPSAGAVVLFAAAFVSLSGQEVLGFVFPWRDNIFYALVSNHLYTTGTESFYLNHTILNSAEAKPVPYHYLELWLNAALSELFGGLYFLNLMLVTYAALQTLILTGILALWEHYFSKVNWLGILICFQLLFLKGIVFNSYAAAFSEVPVIDQLSVNATGLKFLTGFIIFIGFTNALIRRYWVLAALTLGLYPVAHIVALPGVLAGAGGLLVFFLILPGLRTGSFKISKALRIAGLFVAVVLLLGLFYAVFGAHQSGTKSQNILLIIKTFRPENLKQTWLAFLHNLLRAALITWPFLLPGLLLLLAKNRPERGKFLSGGALPVFIFAAFALTGGAVLSSVLYQTIEGHQPLQILVPVLNSALILWLILLLKKGVAVRQPLLRNLFFALVAVLLLLSFNPLTRLFQKGSMGAKNLPYQQYSPAYLSQIQKLFATENFNPVGSCILGTSDLDYFYGYSPLHFTLGLYLPYISNNTFVFSLSEFSTPFPEDPFQKQQALDNTSSGAFYQFVQLQKNTGRFTSIQQSQTDFIRKHHLGYVIISPNARANPLLQKMVKRQIKDPVSGEIFLQLK